MPKNLYAHFKTFLIINLLLVGVGLYQRNRVPTLLPQARLGASEYSIDKAASYLYFQNKKYYVIPKARYTIQGAITKKNVKMFNAPSATSLVMSWGGMERAYIGALTDSTPIQRALDDLKIGDQLFITGEIVQYGDSEEQLVSLPDKNYFPAIYTVQYVRVTKIELLKKNHWDVVFKLSLISLCFFTLFYLDADKLLSKKRPTFGDK